MKSKPLNDRHAGLDRVGSGQRPGAAADWAAFEGAVNAARLPSGYRFEVLRRHGVEELIAGVRSWYPDISVGAASGLIRREFYADRVRFDKDGQGDTLIVTIRHAGHCVGVVVCEAQCEALTLYGRLVAVSSAHRGARLGQRGVTLIESIGEALGMGLVYGMATMKIPHVQRAFEKLGWRLVGIVPGLDRELDQHGEILRIYEAMYVKVLAARGDMQLPRLQNMTAAVRTLFLHLFGRRHAIT